MAVIKHLASKSSDYGATISYLTTEHDEESGRQVIDDEGRPVPRSDFLIDGINCEALEYPLAARLAAAEHGKNEGRGEVKSHHYILSFDPRDADVGLTMAEAHSMALAFARRQFGGHVGVVATHPGGHRGSGNVHAHIVICSVRSFDEPQREWMTQRSEWAAGCKHHPTPASIEALKAEVMDMCRKRNLHQVDLLSPARERKTDREHWAEVRLEARARLEREEGCEPGASRDGLPDDGKGDHRGDRTPERGAADDGRGPDLTAGVNEVAGESGGARRKPSRYTTQKQQLRSAIRDAAVRATDYDSFAAILETDHGIEAKMSRGRISYRHPDRERNVTGRALGVDYEWPIIDANIRSRIEHGGRRPRQSLVSQIDDAMRARGAAYVDAVRSSNIRKLSESVAFLQEAGFESRAELDAALSMSSESLAAAKSSLEAAEAGVRRANRAIRASGAYLSTRDVWRAYRASSDRRAFYLAHRADLEKCNRARRELAEIFPSGKAPSINEMREERRRLERERDAKYEAWTTERYHHRELETAKRNVDAILGGRDAAKRNRSRGGDGLE